MTAPRLRSKHVSFDCYGTLIHFDIAPTTRRLIGDRLTEPEIEVFLRQFSKYRYDQVCGEFYSYEQVLHDAYARTCARWNLEVNEDAGAQLAAAVLTWGPHDDVVEPLKKMAEHFKLVILSNADTTFLDVAVPKLEAEFHAVYTAEQAPGRAGDLEVDQRSEAVERDVLRAVERGGHVMSYRGEC